MKTPEKPSPVMAVPMYLPGSIASSPNVLVRSIDMATPMRPT